MNEIDTKFAQLGKILFARAAGHIGAGECDEQSEELMDIAVSLGLARKEPYARARHGPMDSERGDLIWIWDHLPEGWNDGPQFVDRASGQPQHDLTQRGVLLMP